LFDKQLEIHCNFYKNLSSYVGLLMFSYLHFPVLAFLLSVRV